MKAARPGIGSWYEPAQPPGYAPLVKVTYIDRREVGISGPGLKHGFAHRSLREFWSNWQPVRPETLRWLDQGSKPTPWMVPGMSLIANDLGPLRHHKDRAAEIVELVGGLVFWRWSDLPHQLEMFEARYMALHFTPPPTFWNRLALRGFVV